MLIVETKKTVIKNKKNLMDYYNDYIKLVNEHNNKIIDNNKNGNYNKYNNIDNIINIYNIEDFNNYIGINIIIINDWLVKSNKNINNINDKNIINYKELYNVLNLIYIDIREKVRKQLINLPTRKNIDMIIKILDKNIIDIFGEKEENKQTINITIGNVDSDSYNKNNNNKNVIKLKD